MYAQGGDSGSWTPGKTKDAQGGAVGEALDELLLAPAAILEGLPDAVVAAARDGRIVFVNALAEELFGYPREELLGQPVQTLWPERVRERYTRNMQLYFATEHPLRFSTEVTGLRRDGSEFVGEMSWGIVDTDRRTAAARDRPRHLRAARRRGRACGRWRRWASVRWRAPIQRTSPPRRSS